MPFDLIIFDCDGVLVDSEMLSADVLMGMMAEEGLPITVESFRADFLGRSFASAARQAEIRYGRALPDDFQLRYRSRLLDAMSKSLQPMEGVEAVLSTLLVPHCLATSSSPQRLALSLAVTGLKPYFNSLCTTASEVMNGKPAPDVFLRAAEKMGVAPKRCLVLEDSEMGVRAGLAAGMTVWHFAGGAHIKAGYALPLELQRVRSLSHMRDVYTELRAAGICRG